MKPVVLYVDDEPNNLTVFEAALPDSWTVITMDNPVQALSRLEEIDPWVIVSDQRMPSMKGVEFLELARKLKPITVRIIVTGYSDEDLVIESVRKAQVFDYLRKPWDADAVEVALTGAAEHYRLARERERMIDELKAQQAALESKNADIEKAKLELELASRREAEMRRELECWVPPFVLEALKTPGVSFPATRDLVGIAFDIVGSSKIHGLTVGDKPLRARIIELFSEAILRNGGFRESHSGDSAYAHFGLMGESEAHGESALAAAREFRVALRSLKQVHGYDVECGIALHKAKDAVVDVHTVQLKTARGLITQKSFDTTSSEIDLLHRIEKLVHALPGSNIVMTESFLDSLNHRPLDLIELGLKRLEGQEESVRLYLVKSDLVTPEALEEFKEREFALSMNAA